jgi:uncharacterized membrane protein
MDAIGMLSPIDPIQLHHKAVANAGSAVVSTVIAHYGANEIIQIISGIAAIIFSCAAAAYYILLIVEKLRRK